MALNAQILKLQEEIYEELARPSSISSNFIGNWVITNAGRINNVIGTSYSGICDSGLAPLMEEDEIGITKLLFQNYWLGREIKSNLGANGYVISEVSEGDSKIKVVTKTEVAKNLQVLQKQNYQELRDAVTAYRVKSAVPRQSVVSGQWTDDYPCYYGY